MGEKIESEKKKKKRGVKNKKIKEVNREGRKKKQYRNSHLPPAERCLVSLQEMAALEKLSPCFIAERDVTWYEILFWSVWVN